MCVSRMPLAILLSFAVTVLAGCDTTPLVAPNNSTLTISAGARVLPLGGRTEVSAFVVEASGTPVQNGTTVRFTTNLGRLDPVEAQTRNGLAVATFHAGDVSGVAQVRASSGGIGAGGGGEGATSGNVVEIQLGAAAANAVVVSADPSSVSSIGGTVTVIASAVDESGNRLTGAPVSFSTTQGTLSASSATTDANGEARVTLTTTREATVTARVGTQTATTTVNVLAPTSVALQVSPTNPLAQQPVTLTVTPTIPAGGVPPRVVVNWGDGATEDLGTVTAARGVTHIYNTAASYSITATATAGSESFVTSAGVVVGAAAPVLLTVSPSSGTTNTTFIFTVTPAAGTVPQDVLLDFGDGDSVNLGSVSTGVQVAHRYQTTGSKTVRVTQTNANGTTSTNVVVVQVSNP